MKKLFVAGIVAAAFCSAPALAADLKVKAPAYKAIPAPAPVFNWAGCYVGGNVGGGWSDKSFTEDAGAASPGASDGSHTASGWVGGGQIGCDYQFANTWVIGIQGMFDWASLTGSNQGPVNLGSFAWHTKVGSFTTVTANLAYLLNPTTKFYGKAGIGWVKDDFTCDGPACNPSQSASGTRSGLDLGVGLAWMFTPNWDLWVEYDHMWLGTKTLSFPATINFTSFDESIKQDLSKVIVGIDYRFNWGQAPVVVKY